MYGSEKVNIAVYMKICVSVAYLPLTVAGSDERSILSNRACT